MLELDFNVLYLVTRTWNTSKTSGFPKTSANFPNAFWVFGTSSSQGLGKEKAIEKIILRHEFARAQRARAGMRMQGAIDCVRSAWQRT